MEPETDELKSCFIDYCKQVDANAAERLGTIRRNAKQIIVIGAELNELAAAALSEDAIKCATWAGIATDAANLKGRAVALIDALANITAEAGQFWPECSEVENAAVFDKFVNQEGKTLRFPLSIQFE